MSKRHNRTYTTVKADSFIATMHEGFNYFHEIELTHSKIRQHRNRPKGTQSNLEHDRKNVQKMLSQNKQTFTRIKTEFNSIRDQQLNQYIKKSLKYQQILNINDNKKKRLPTLNAKIGEIIKKSVVQNTAKNIEYTLFETQYKMDGWKPESREGHTTTVYKNMAIIIGGHCSTPFSMAQIFSFDNNNWVKQFMVSSARSYHSSIFYKNRFIIVFGGMGVYDISRKCRVCYNSINLIDLQTWTSRVLRMSNQQTIEGRRNHGVILMGKYMVILGGINTRRQYLRDFVYLDLKELKWYHKQYKIQGKELSENMESGLAKHKMISIFRSSHKNLPLYSSEYTEQQGVYIFGGTFGNGDENILLFLSFSNYNPTLRRLQYVGIPPSSTDPIVQRINQNLILIISGETTDRRMKLFRIKQRQFIGITKANPNSFYGGLGSTVTKYDDQFYLFFGLGASGYIGTVHSFRIEEKITESELKKRKQRSYELDWKGSRDLDSESESFI